ncbi:hypothetical protein EDC01DRAFT_28228 [Geopyxis carbonaria]|nr:hypothetical protein EDC01DRAFT_28228 [Geopyxis carbonaria]
MPPHTNEPEITPSFAEMNLHNETVDSSSSSASFSAHTTTSSSTTSYRYLGNVTSSHRPLVPGMYAPTPAFFDPLTDDLDMATIRSHTVRLAAAGCAGIVTQGSNGEAVHLSHSERRIVTAMTREALDDAGYTSLPVIVGCGAQSTRETIELCHDALLSGGDYALVLPASYYKTLYTPASQLEFFHEVADASPIPLLIYNFPGAVSGIDLDSDVVTKLSKHPNIVGVKLTCGNTGKLGRVCAATPNDGTFLTLAGSCDFTLQSLVVGGSGVIGGLANIAPRACTAVYDLWISGARPLAEKFQAVVARGDWVAIKGGVVATKAALNAHYGYGGFGRKPLPRPAAEQVAEIKAEIEELVLLEQFLERGGREQDIHYTRAKELPQLVEAERMWAAARTSA